MADRLSPVSRCLVLIPAAVIAVVGFVRADPPPQRPRTAEPPSSKSVTPAAALMSEPMLKGLSARSIGPAVMGGRISDIAIDPATPWTFYVATAHGGLMKTTDNGGTFSDMSDKEGVPSMGAVAVAPSDAKVVWLGTGEANDRNSAG